MKRCVSGCAVWRCEQCEAAVRTIRVLQGSAIRCFYGGTGGTGALGGGTSVMRGVCVGGRV